MPLRYQKVKLARGLQKPKAELWISAPASDFSVSECDVQRAQDTETSVQMCFQVGLKHMRILLGHLLSLSASTADSLESHRPGDRYPAVRQNAPIRIKIREFPQCDHRLNSLQKHTAFVRVAIVSQSTRASAREEPSQQAWQVLYLGIRF